MSAQDKILVIKLGALGDFIQSLGPMAAIRKHHPDANITLLTTKPFKSFAEKSGYFDHIWLDERPRFADITKWISLRKTLNSAGFTRVYDLQNNDRTAFYLRLFKKKPEWVGATPGASHRNTSPARTAGHAFDGHVQTLALAGIENIKTDDLSWIEEDLRSFPLRRPYILIVPGCAPEHPQKRWPAQHYARLASMLARWGYQPVLLGTHAEHDVIETIVTQCPDALDLGGQTNLFQIVAMGREAAAAIGNDTGPMHLIAATGCPCLSLFSGHTHPERHAPCGSNVTVLQENNLADLDPEKVLKAFKPREQPKPLETVH